MASNFNYELQILPLAHNYLKEAAKWAKIIAIIGFILVGLYVILAIFSFMAGGAVASADMEGIEGMEAMGSQSKMLGAMGGVVMGIVYLLAALLYFFPIMYLYKFANKANFALDNKNSEALTDSFENLKSHYKFVAILMILSIILMIIGVIAVMVFAGSVAASM